MYDLSSGEIFEYSRLEKELIPFMQRMAKPLPAVCPSGLRYSLAKYEVSEIYSSYDRLLSLINTERLVFTRPEEITENAKINLSSTDVETAIKAFSSAVNSIPTVESLTVIAREPDGIAFAERIKLDFSFIDVKIEP